MPFVCHCCFLKSPESCLKMNSVATMVFNVTINKFACIHIPAETLKVITRDIQVSGWFLYNRGVSFSLFLWRGSIFLDSTCKRWCFFCLMWLDFLTFASFLLSFLRPFLTFPSVNFQGRMKRSDPSSQALRSEGFLLQALVCFQSACRSGHC